MNLVNKIITIGKNIMKKDEYTPFSKIKSGLDFVFDSKSCKLISEGDDKITSTNTTIKVEQNHDGSIKFSFIKNSFDIVGSVTFDMVYTGNDRICCATIPEKTNIENFTSFYSIKYSVPFGFKSITRKSKDFGPNEPFHCSIFTENSVVKKLAFRYENPSRIMEFE